jgi:xylulokinase
MAIGVEDEEVGGGPVAIGTNDVAAAHVGAGNGRRGQVMNTAGSSDMVSILTDVPDVSRDYYLRCSATPGLWQIYATTAGGFALDWFHEQFARELDDREFYGPYLDGVVSRLIRRARRESQVVFEPYLTGDRQSLTAKSASWTGLTLMATREDLLASLLDGMVRVLGDTIALASQATVLDRTIKISGGLATNSLIALKRHVWPGFVFQPVANCSILGNVRLALPSLRGDSAAF